MRAALALLSLSLVATSALAQPIGPATDAKVDDARNEARWAELEAQSRIIEGDYEGAVQAQRQADAARRTADRLEAYARPAGPQR